MKKMITVLAAALFAAGAQSATVTTGSAKGGAWEGTDFQTIQTRMADWGYDLKLPDVNGVIQSFTAPKDMTVESISILAQRLVPKEDFGFDVWELFDGKGKTPEANPDKVRLGRKGWSTNIVSCTLNSPVEIKRGGRGENMFTVTFDASERFSLKAGHAYAVHIYSKMAPDSPRDRLLLWDCASTNAYEGGTYAVYNATAARDLGLAVTAVKEQ